MIDRTSRNAVATAAPYLTAAQRGSAQARAPKRPTTKTTKTT